MLAWVIIGFFVSIVLGLTGAGGGIVSLSLFLFFFVLSLQKATVLSLLAIGAGSLLNWLFNLRKTAYFLAFSLAFFSIPGSFIGVWLKMTLPYILQKAIFVVIIIYGLITFWTKDGPKSQASSYRKKPKYIYVMLGGVILGAFTTLTGLGGGVIQMPLLLAYGLNMDRTLASAYLITFLTAAGSLFIQSDTWIDHQNIETILPLIIGTCLGSLTLKFTRAKLSEAHYSLLRKVVFTAVVFSGLTSIINS